MTMCDNCNPLDTPCDAGQPYQTVAMFNLPPISESAQLIARTCDRIKAILVEKNNAYGNSALDPIRLFSEASPEEQLLVRIDDKLSRIQRGHEYIGDDTITDLVGYLILLLTYRES